MPSRTEMRMARQAIDRVVASLESREHITSRRSFLRLGAASLASTLLAACGSNGPDSAQRVLKFAGEKNEAVERWLFRHTSMDHASASGIVAGARFPSYFISRQLPTWDIAARGEWALEVTGMVRTPLRLDLPALMAMSHVEQRVDHFCVEGWNAIARFRGVPMHAIAKLAGVLPGAEVVDFQSFDDGYHESWDIDSVLHPQTLVVYAKDGQLLSPAYGAPARLHSPVKLGYKNTKYLTRVAFMAQKNGGYWTDNGYDWYGGT